MTIESPDLFRGVTDHQLAQAADGGCDDLDCKYHGRINTEIARRAQEAKQ